MPEHRNDGEKHKEVAPTPPTLSYRLGRSRWRQSRWIAVGAFCIGLTLFMVRCLPVPFEWNKTVFFSYDEVEAPGKPASHKAVFIDCGSGMVHVGFGWGQKFDDKVLYDQEVASGRIASGSPGILARPPKVDFHYNLWLLDVGSFVHDETAFIRHNPNYGGGSYNSNAYVGVDLLVPALIGLGIALIFVQRYRRQRRAATDPAQTDAAAPGEPGAAG